MCSLSPPTNQATNPFNSNCSDLTGDIHNYTSNSRRKSKIDSKLILSLFLAGSTALGFYTPVKASPMDSLFQLGVTRYNPPDSPSAATSNGNLNSNGNGNGTGNENGSIMGLGEGLIKDEESDEKDRDDDDVDYLMSGGGIVYSEGTQKTDLLYWIEIRFLYTYYIHEYTTYTYIYLCIYNYIYHLWSPFLMWSVAVSRRIGSPTVAQFRLWNTYILLLL